MLTYSYQNLVKKYGEALKNESPYFLNLIIYD